MNLKQRRRRKALHKKLNREGLTLLEAAEFYCPGATTDEERLAALKKLVERGEVVMTGRRGSPDAPREVIPIAKVH